MSGSGGPQCRGKIGVTGGKGQGTGHGDPTLPAVRVQGQEYEANGREGRGAAQAPSPAREAKGEGSHEAVCRGSPWRGEAPGAEGGHRGEHVGPARRRAGGRQG